MRSRVDALLLAAATAVGIVVCFLLAVPFVGPLTGALALAILFAPLHARIEARLRHPNLAAMLSVLALALMVAPPAAFVLGRLVEEAAISASYIQKPVDSGAVQRVIGLCHIAVRRVVKICASRNNQTAATAVRHLSIAAARST